MAILIGLAIVVSALYFAALGVWAYVLLATAFAASLSLAALLVQPPEKPTEEAELDKVREDLLEQQGLIDQREQDLANRLAVYHEWMEFPQPIDLAAMPSEDELSELAAKDRELNELLGETAEQLFNDVLANKYAPDGRFSLSILRDDAQALAEKVAGIYQDQSDQPLLNTNMEGILRAASRVCLQMLTLLDQLPLDVKKHNIENLYAYVRRAVQAYGAYRKAEPYWGYVNGVYYLGRLAMGAHPVSMGAWWLAGQVGKRATKRLTAKFVNRQALTLLHQTIRTVGYEVANLYGAGFRYRDANWIYAAELTELLLVLPVNHRCLSQSLQEIGSLALRSEFDRVFLYRCVTERVTAKPEQYRAAYVLTPGERQAVAKRLERFANAFSGAASPARMDQWLAETEARLDVRLQLEGRTQEDTPELQQEAVRALMGFLVEVKQLETDEAWQRVAETPSMKAMDAQQVDAMQAVWHENPAYFFELPDLPPDGASARDFFHDLVELAVTVAPRGPEVTRVLENVAAFLRIPEKEVEKTLTRRCNQAIDARFPTTPPKLNLDAALALLSLLDEVDLPLFLFTGIQPKWPESAKSGAARSNAHWHLLGDAEQLQVFAVHDGRLEVLWRAGKGQVTAEKGRYLSGEYSLEGGKWQQDSTAPERLVVRSGRFSLRRSSEYYRSLIEWTTSHESSPSETLQDSDDSKNSQPAAKAADNSSSDKGDPKPLPDLDSSLDEGEGNSEDEPDHRTDP